MNPLQYVQLGVGTVLIGVILFLKLDMTVIKAQRDLAMANVSTLSIQVANLNKAIVVQNSAIGDLKKAIIIEQQRAAENLVKAKVKTKVIYMEAAKIEAAVGVTCNDAEQLIRASVQ